MEKLTPKTFYELTDSDVERITKEHYGKGYYPDSEEIGGDDSGGYQQIPATLADLDKYSYWIDQAEKYFSEVSNTDRFILHGVIHKLVKDGHIPPGNYLIEGIWG